jgi:hypothetical protein
LFFLPFYDYAMAMAMAMAMMAVMVLHGQKSEA